MSTHLSRRQFVGQNIKTTAAAGLGVIATLFHTKGSAATGSAIRRSGYTILNAWFVKKRGSAAYICAPDVSAPQRCWVTLLAPDGPSSIREPHMLAGVDEGVQHWLYARAYKYRIAADDLEKRLPR